MNNYDNDDKICMDLPVGPIVQYFLLMTEKGLSSEDALALAHSKNYDEIDKITNANDLIMFILHETERVLFVGFHADHMEEVVRGDIDEIGSDFLKSIGEAIINANMESGKLIDKIVAINKTIHDYYVRNNVKNYDKKKDYLLQYLPQELMGIENLNKTFMVMAPLFDKFGLPLGEMQEKPYGVFECNDAPLLTYIENVKQFLKDNNIKSKTDLKNYIKDIANNYDALKPENAPAGKQDSALARIKAITNDENIDKLVNHIISNNQNAFENFDSFTQE